MRRRVPLELRFRLKIPQQPRETASPPRPYSTPFISVSLRFSPFLSQNDDTSPRVPATVQHNSGARHYRLTVFFSDIWYADALLQRGAPPPTQPPTPHFPTPVINNPQPRSRTTTTTTTWTWWTSRRRSGWSRRPSCACAPGARRRRCSCSTKPRDGTPAPGPGVTLFILFHLILLPTRTQNSAMNVQAMRICNYKIIAWLIDCVFICST